MSIEEILTLKDGARVVLTQVGTEWGEDKDSSGICIKIGNRLVEADIERPTDENIWYSYYSIDELNDKGYECTVELENMDGSTAICGYKQREKEILEYLNHLIDNRVNLGQLEIGIIKDIIFHIQYIDKN